MPAIRKSEAIELLAKAVEAASSDDLADFYAELFPDRPAIRPANAASRRGEMVEYVRTKMEPEEVVDLWNVVFPADRNVYYDDADELVCYDQAESRYAGR